MKCICGSIKIIIDYSLPIGHPERQICAGCRRPIGDVYGSTGA